MIVASWGGALSPFKTLCLLNNYRFLWQWSVAVMDSHKDKVYIVGWFCFHWCSLYGHINFIHVLAVGFARYYVLTGGKVTALLVVELIQSFASRLGSLLVKVSGPAQLQLYLWCKREKKKKSYRKEKKALLIKLCWQFINLLFFCGYVFLKLILNLHFFFWRCFFWIYSSGCLAWKKIISFFEKDIDYFLFSLVIIKELSNDI